MALQTKDLSVLAYANVFTLWHYTTTNSAVALTKEGPGYFDPAHAMLRADDIILANARADGRPCAAMLMVAGNESDKIAVTELTGPGHA